MDLYDVMRTTFAAREFTAEPLPDSTLYRILDNARFALGGMVGVALWFRRRSDTSQPHCWLTLTALLPEFGVVLIVYAGLVLIDVARLPQGLHLALCLVITVFAVLALRVVLQAALLREEHEPGSSAPLLCPNCEQLVADMAFCSNCGWPCHVVGCGPIGMAIIVALKACGASPISASDLSPSRHAPAMQLGADIVLDPAEGTGFPDFAELGVPPPTPCNVR